MERDKFWAYIQFAWGIVFFAVMVWLSLWAFERTPPEGCNLTCIEPLIIYNEGTPIFMCNKYECVDRAFSKENPTFFRYLCEHNMTNSSACALLD